MTRSSRPFTRLLTAAALVVAGVGAVVAAPVVTTTPAAATGCPTTAGSYAGGAGTSGSPFQIATTAQLLLLAATQADWSKHFVQTANISMAGCTWTGIGGAGSNPFTGTYDGNDHIISNVSISASTDYWGLFRSTANATLRDLTLDGVTISASGRDFLGALVGRANTTTVHSVTVLGAHITGRRYVGGLIGDKADGSIANSSTAGTVIAPHTSTGGLVGENRRAPITDSYSSADVIGDGYVGGLVGYHRAGPITNSYTTGDVSGDQYVGGLVGWFYDTTIERSFTTGDVTGGFFGYAGGLVGWSRYGSVIDSYATGDVSSDYYVGGLLGYFEDGPITNSYSTGSVSATVPPVGGLVADNVRATITASFWDTETSRRATSDGGTGRTTAHMTTFTTFDTAGWSITNGDADQTKVWGICDGLTYPFLMWQTQLPVGEPGRMVCPTAAGTTPVVVLPPEINELITQPVATSTSTTIAPSTTTTTVAVDTTTPADLTPPPVFIDGALPELPAGDVVVVEDGAPVDVETIADGNTLVLQASTFELRLEGNCATGGCTIDITPEGRAVLTLEQDGSAATTGVGFQPGSTVHVWLFSEPRYLGDITVNADGSFTGNIDLGDIDVGEHTLQVNGTSQTGAQRSANLGVIVNPQALPTPGAGVLPSTGTSTTPLWLVALTLLGLGLVAMTRRRSA